MASLPYVTSPGNIIKALDAIKAAAVPPKVTQDFVKTILKIPSGSGDQMTVFLKKIGLANGDSTPSELYTKFRNPAYSGQSIAAAIRHGYGPLYRRNEYMHTLDDKDLIGLIVEETGVARDHSSVKPIAACIRNLKMYATFGDASAVENLPATVEQSARSNDNDSGPSQRRPEKHFGLNLGYTININLPATSDQTVFNAIFRSIKENLLSDDDA